VRLGVSSMNWHVPSYATAAALSTASARTLRAPQLFAFASGATDCFEEQSLHSIRAGPELHSIS
jgi:hypothetical protein